MAEPEVGHHLELMLHLLGIGDPMPALGVDHHLELLARFLEPIGQLQGVGHVDVVVDLAMDEHELAMQIRCRLDDRTGLVPLGVGLRGAHVPLGVNRVVVSPVGYRCASYPRPKELAVGHRIRTEVPAITPTPNSEPIRVGPGFLGQPCGGVLEVLQLQRAEVLVDLPCVGVPFAQRRAVVAQEHRDPLVGQVTVPKIAAMGPGVFDRRCSGPGIDVDHHRDATLQGRIETSCGPIQ